MKKTRSGDYKRNRCVMVRLNDTAHAALKRAAARQGRRAAELAANLVIDWLLVERRQGSRP
jgi:hypothetical protein